MARAAKLALLGALVWGCGESRQAEAPQPTTPVAPTTHAEPAEAEPEPAELAVTAEGAQGDSPEVHSPTIRVTAAEARAHGLTPVDIAIDAGDVALFGRKFGSERTYLSLSGPPGGPLGLHFTQHPSLPADEAAWTQLVQDRYGERFPEVGTAATVTMAGAERPAFSFTTDRGHARSHHLFVWFAAPGGGGILMDFDHGADESSTPAPGEVLTVAQYQDMLGSIRVEFAASAGE